MLDAQELTSASYLAVIGLLMLLSALVFWLVMRRGVSFRFSLPWALLLLVIVLLGSRLSAVLQVYERQQVKDAMFAIAPTFALGMHENGHADITLDTPADDPTYLKLIGMQKRRLAVAKDVADIYTMRLDERGKLRIIVDSETDYDHSGSIDAEREERTDIGHPYETDQLDAFLQSFDGKVTFDDVPYTDAWGTWVSATAPIYDSDGKVEAILGVDYPADRFVAAQDRARHVVLCFVAGLFLLFLTAYAASGLTRVNLKHRSRIEAELRLASEQASAASRAKSLFMANMSHELRTPLTAIIGFTELVLAERSPEALEEAIPTIKRNGDQLLNIINNVLALTAMETEKLSTQDAPINTLDFAHELLQLARQRSTRPDVPVRLNCDTLLPKSFNADVSRLRYILTQLIDNAIKFTPSGSIDIAVRFVEIDGKQFIYFEVIDTGIGIGEAAIGKLFRPFEQLDTGMSRRFGGSGLGLAVSHRMAQAMGLELVCTSVPGAGSTFSLRLPLAGQNVALVPVENGGRPPTLLGSISPKEPLANLCILVVDDQPDNRALLTRLLGKMGASVRTANEGQAAIDAILNSDKWFDLVLMDMQMPGVDGYRATQHLRAAGCRLPIIALTAHTQPGDRENCLHAGCDDYASKPIQAKELVQLISKYAAAKRPFASAA